MKFLIFAIFMYFPSLFAMVPEAADIGRMKKHVLVPVERSQEELFKDLVRDSESAYALATAHVGSFKDARLSALTNRIQEDQRVILETLRDTARAERFPVPQKTSALPSDPVSPDDFLLREISIHEGMLSKISRTTSPVLQDVKGRIEAVLRNAKDIRKDRRQTQEESLRRSP